MKNMLKENAKNYTKQISDTTYDADGTKKEVIKNVTYTGKGSNYKTDLTALVNVMLDDQKSMPSYWANITGNKEPWVNSQKQRDEAFELMYDKADKAWGPKVRSETTSETTVEAKPSSLNNSGGNNNKKRSNLSYSSWIDENLKGTSTVTTNMGGQKEVQIMPLSPTQKKVRILKKFTSINPDKYASGQALMDSGLMKKAKPNALYIKTGVNWEVYPNFNNLLEDNKALDEAFIGATPKKKKAYNS